MTFSKSSNTWLGYTFIVAFALYWLSNLILWYPWTVSPKIGIITMLTLNPVLWGIAAYQCLIRFQGKRIIYAAIAVGGIFTIVSVIADFIFIGLIRNSFNNLYQPTTFYGYGFVLTLPFLEALIFQKRIRQKNRIVSKSDFVWSFAVALGCFLLLMLIIETKLF